VVVADLFLTRDEVAVLTGYRQATKQAAHLKRQRIPFHLNRAGHPLVARAIIEGSNRQPQQKAAWSPSWAEDRP
jgi:hypothetical protein